MTESASNFTELYNIQAVESYNATPKSLELLNQTANEEYLLFISREFVENKFFQIFFCIAYMTIFMLGLTGNMLVVYVVVRNKAMHTVTNLFITNLALSDILLCILAVPFTPLYTFTGKIFPSFAGLAVREMVECSSHVPSLLRLMSAAEYSVFGCFLIMESNTR